MSRRKASVISAEARAVLDAWQPAGLDAEDAAAWFVVAAVVRVWVAAAAPDVGGHEILPSGGRVAARWRPTVLPSGGQQDCPR